MIHHHADMPMPIRCLPLSRADQHAPCFTTSTIIGPISSRPDIFSMIRRTYPSLCLAFSCQGNNQNIILPRLVLVHHHLLHSAFLAVVSSATTLLATTRHLHNNRRNGNLTYKTIKSNIETYTTIEQNNQIKY